MTVSGFSGGYSSGNGVYVQFAHHKGRPAYRKDWIIYYTGTRWIIGNYSGFKSNAGAGFSVVSSGADFPFEVEGNWSNAQVGVTETQVKSFVCTSYALKMLVALSKHPFDLNFI